MGEKERLSFVEKWNSVYFFIPVFEAPVKMPPLKDFRDALSKKFGKTEFLSENPEMPDQPGNLLGAALWEHLAFYKKENRSLPSQLVLYGPNDFDQGQWDERIISQFWDCPDRQGFAGRCRYSIMGGIPAKLIRKRFSEEEIAILLSLRWWDWPVEKISAAIPHIQKGNLKALQRMHEGRMPKMDFHPPCS